MAYQVDYTSRDYDSLRDELIKVVQQRVPNWNPNSTSSSSDFGLALVEAFAYAGDLLSYYIDRALNEAAVQTATQKSTLLNFAELFGYRVSGPSPAYVYLTFTNTSANAIDIPAGTQVEAPITTGSYTTAYFETITDYPQLAAGASVTLSAVEGKTNGDGVDAYGYVLPVSLGEASTYAYQEFSIPNSGVIGDSVQVYVGEANALVKWSYVDTIIEYGPDNTVYTTKMDENGTITIIFGDGVCGAIPSGTVSAVYKTSVGVFGNVPSSSVSAYPTYIPGQGYNISSNYGLNVTNASDAFGGTDGENLASLRVALQSTLTARNRAVTIDDYKNLAVGLYGVGRANAESSVYNSVTVYVQPFNDLTATPGISSGTPTASWYSIQAQVLELLTSRCPATTTVTVSPPTYVPIYLALNITVDSAYKQRDVKINVAKALLDEYIGLFSYNSYGFGANITQSAIIALLMAVPGVLNVTFTRLSTTSSGGTAVSDLQLNAGQIASLTAANLTITPTGGFV